MKKGIQSSHYCPDLPFGSDPLRVRLFVTGILPSAICLESNMKEEHYLLDLRIMIQPILTAQSQFALHIVHVSIFEKRLVGETKSLSTRTHAKCFVDIILPSN